MSETALNDLSVRIAALEVERDVLRTLHDYGHAIDYGLDEAWVDCFIEAGVFDIRLRDAPKARYEGRVALRGFIEHHTAIPAAHHKHLVVAPTMTLLSEAAVSVRSYFVRLDDERMGAPVLHGFGRYLDELVRCEDGRWRFVTRVAEIEALDPGGRPGSWEP